jgi:hypothetical protein
MDACIKYILSTKTQTKYMIGVNVSLVSSCIINSYFELSPQVKYSNKCSFYEIMVQLGAGGGHNGALAPWR